MTIIVASNKTILSPESEKSEQPWWVKELTDSFARKALEEQQKMYGSLYDHCRYPTLGEFQSVINKFWPDYFSANDLICGAPLVAHLLYNVGKGDGSSETAKCIDYLCKRCGASLNQPDKNGRSPLDCIICGGYVSDDARENIYNAAKYVLTHGGLAMKRREMVIRFLEYKAGMPRNEFEEFEKIGQCGKPKDLKREALLAANQVLASQAYDRLRIRQERLMELNEKVKSKYASDYDRECRAEILKKLTMTTPERKKKLEEIRDAYRNKPAYLQKQPETEKQRKEKQQSAEIDEIMARHKEPYHGGLLPSRGGHFIGGCRN